jgi:hypothetical protein
MNNLNIVIKGIEVMMGTSRNFHLSIRNGDRLLGFIRVYYIYDQEVIDI